MSIYKDNVVEEYITLTKALKCLPGVKPNKSKKLIEDAYQIELLQDLKGLRISGCKVGKTELSDEEYKEVYKVYETPFSRIIKISPKGAKILMKLYQNGDLEMDKGQDIIDAPDLQSYINKEEYFDKKVKEQEYRKDLVEHPDKIKESDFSYELLNEVFYINLGPFRGEQTMILDGIEVRKSVSVYKSNSGKSQSSEVIISWNGSNGQIHTHKKSSKYSGNRRNDSNRNWGLPE